MNGRSMLALPIASHAEERSHATTHGGIGVRELRGAGVADVVVFYIEPPPPPPPRPPAVPGERIEIKAWPQRNFRPERMAIRFGHAWQIEDIRIGNETCLPLGPISGEAFEIDGAETYAQHQKRQAIADMVQWRTALAGECITIVVVYQGSDREVAELHGRLFGAILGFAP